MSAFIEDNSRSIPNRDALVDWLASGEKPRKDWRIGSENEKIVFHRDTLDAVPFDHQQGITGILSYLAQEHGWKPFHEDGKLVALAKDGASISLEPGGQLELSGAPLENLHQTCHEITTNFKELRPFFQEHNLGMLSLGYNPRQEYEHLDWVPKSRYRILRSYLESTSQSFAPKMMSMSTTVQVNLDFLDEQDFVRKTRLACLIQPVIAAVFANSPFAQSGLSEYHSVRNYLWNNIDPQWTGIPAVVFEDGFGYERWIDYLLERPCIFLRSGSTYSRYQGGSFLSLMKEATSKRPVTFGDWQTHLTTVFTDVRIKRFIELRAFDSQPLPGLCAMPAFWTGLLYSDRALDQGEELVSEWGYEDSLELRERLPKDGLSGAFKKRPLWEWVDELVKIASAGLADRAFRLDNAEDERIHLKYLEDIVQARTTPADRLRRSFVEDWNRDMRQVYQHCDFLSHHV